MNLFDKHAHSTSDCKRRLKEEGIKIINDYDCPLNNGNFKEIFDNTFIF